MPPTSTREPHSPRLANRVRAFDAALRDLASYSKLVGRPLRPYQLEPGRAILEAVAAGQGGSFSVQMARQAGKNELSAHVEAYLLTLHRSHGGSIVKCAPTYQIELNKALNEYIATKRGT